MTKDLKMCSSLIIRDMSIKTLRNYYLTPVSVATIKKKRARGCGGRGEIGTFFIAGGNGDGAGAEKGSPIPQTDKTRIIL